MSDLGRVAVWNVIEDSGISLKNIQVAYVASSLGGPGRAGGDPGQVILRDAGFGGIPDHQRGECLRQWHNGIPRRAVGGGFWGL